MTSLNVTLLRAGLSAGGNDVLNVVPSNAEAGLDIRIAPHVPPAEISALLDGWCEEASRQNPGASVKWEFAHEPLMQHATTSVQADNPWFRIFEETLREKCGGISCKTEVFPAATDSRFLRAIGVKAFGFSPIRRSKIMLHENDEYLEEKVFLEGCDVYVVLMHTLTNEYTIK